MGNAASHGLLVIINRESLDGSLWGLNHWARSVSSEKLLDEDNHLWLLDGTGAVLVEGGEDLIESLLGELVSRSEVSKSILNELLGLLLIESTAFVDIISVPDLVDDALGSLIFGSRFFLIDFLK